jgi:hypothetical protein
MNLIFTPLPIKIIFSPYIFIYLHHGPEEGFSLAMRSHDPWDKKCIGWCDAICECTNGNSHVSPVTSHDWPRVL